jgi:hypothetical protein
MVVELVGKKDNEVKVLWHTGPDNEPIENVRQWVPVSRIENITTK